MITPSHPIVTIRASSLGELFDCAARWEAKYIRKLRLPSSGNAQLGTAIHASTALYDRSTITGEGLTIDDCVGALVDAIHRPEGEVSWEEDLQAREAEQIGRVLHARYCREVAPRHQYTDVEVKCESLVFKDLRIRLTGTTDRIRETGGVYGVVDIKSGRTAVRVNGVVDIQQHVAQLGVYELLAQEASKIPITEPARVVGLQTGKTAKAQRVGTRDISGARALLIGTPDAPGALEHAAAIIHSGMFPGNPRSVLCSPKYCPIAKTCRFRLE